MFIKDLTKNQSFVLPGQETVYVAESVRVQDGYAYVTYSLMDGTRSGFGTRPLSTVIPC
jgi:hypothetical protein